MGACDCIITKVNQSLLQCKLLIGSSLKFVDCSYGIRHLQAGPGTIAEAMIRGLPIILNDYIAGQVNFQFTFYGFHFIRFLIVPTLEFYIALAQVYVVLGRS